LFGVTLWCKTMVLRKDKVTQCVTALQGEPMIQGETGGRAISTQESKVSSHCTGE